MQNNLIPVINCPLWCMNWYSWGILRSSLRIRTHLLHIRTVVKFTTIRCGYGMDAFRCNIFFIGASRMKTFIENQYSSTNSGSLQATVGSDAPNGYI